MQDQSVEESFIDRLYSATSPSSPEMWNDPFSYRFMDTNEYGPQYVAEIHHFNNLVNMFEDDSKLKNILHNVLETEKNALYSCGSINGKMTNHVLVKKMQVRQTQIPAGSTSSSSIAKLFGGSQSKEGF